MKKHLNVGWGSLNGVLAIIFGLIALFFPGITLAALGIYFALAILIGGVALIASAFRIKPRRSKWYLLLVEGIIGIFIGAIILARPELVATVFVTILGIWAFILGLVFLVTWGKRRLPPFSNTFILIVSILSILMGVLIIVDPFESTRVITVLIGFYVLLYGLFSFINSVKIYR